MSPLSTYKVALVGRRKRDTVRATYFKIEAGVLTFRIYQGYYGSSQYPLFVKCYAAGSWLTVENVTQQESTT
jgi:hypothetical protein